MQWVLRQCSAGEGEGGQGQCAGLQRPRGLSPWPAPPGGRDGPTHIWRRLFKRLEAAHPPARLGASSPTIFILPGSVSWRLQVHPPRRDLGEAVPRAWGHRAQASLRDPHRAVELKGHFARSARPGPGPRQSWDRAEGWWWGQLLGRETLSPGCALFLPQDPSHRQAGRSCSAKEEPLVGRGLALVSHPVGQRGGSEWAGDEWPGSALPSWAVSDYLPSAGLCTGSQEAGDQECSRGWGQTDCQSCSIQQASRTELVPSTYPEALDASALGGDSSSLPTTLLPLQLVAQVPARISPRRARGNLLSTNQQRDGAEALTGVKAVHSCPTASCGSGQGGQDTFWGRGCPVPCTCPLEKPLPTQCAPTLSWSHLSTTGAGGFQHSAFLCPRSRARVASHQPGTVPAPGPLPGYSGTHPIPQISGKDSASSVHDLQPSKAPQCPCSGCSQVPSWHHWARPDARWTSAYQDGPRGANGSSWRGREQLTAALEGGHFPEKSPDGTWSAWGEERKLLLRWRGSSEGGVLVY